MQKEIFYIPLNVKINTQIYSSMSENPTLFNLKVLYLHRQYIFIGQSLELDRGDTCFLSAYFPEISVIVLLSGYKYIGQYWSGSLCVLYRIRSYPLCW